jgi:hypothetical protein
MFGEELMANFSTDRIENNAFNNLIVACIRCRGKILPSRCLATIEGIHIQTRRLMEGIYELRY